MFAIVEKVCNFLCFLMINFPVSCLALDFGSLEWGSSKVDVDLSTHQGSGGRTEIYKSINFIFILLLYNHYGSSVMSNARCAPCTFSHDVLPVGLLGVQGSHRVVFVQRLKSRKVKSNLF